MEFKAFDLIFYFRDLFSNKLSIIQIEQWFNVGLFDQNHSLSYYKITMVIYST